MDCGRDEQNEFIHNLACTYNEIGVSATYLAVEGGQCVGFIALPTDSIELSQHERPDGVRFAKLPALKICQLGVDKPAQGRGISRELVAYALLIARLIRGHIGLVYLSVDAKPDVIGLYEKLGFKRNKVEARRKRDREGTNYDRATATVSMRLDIREPGEVPAQLGAITGVSG